MTTKIDDLFTTTVARANPGEEFRLPDDPPFTSDDRETIERYGLMRWAISQENLVWDDNLFDWRSLPNALRLAIMSEIIDDGLPRLHYAIPFRNLGRVFILALLPVPLHPIRVVRHSAPRSLPAPRRRLLDPPIPFMTMGIAQPQTLELHSRCVRDILNGNPNTIKRSMVQIMNNLAREEQITKSEWLYYAVSMHALYNGSWRQFEQYFGLLQLEEAILQADNLSPAQPQLLAYSHLVEGNPITGDDPHTLVVTQEAAS